ncbi:MAG: AmmeMemoRadiSam system radical SAM enzyme [Humidesulfovibrio sp.]|nr:AmmeMemoRadiSam system radical SAM enzyme [Humidesulfovibrio sp.]
MDTLTREARFWKPLAPGKAGQGASVQCRLCNHFCSIPDGGRGICAVRQNQAGTLYTLVYGLPAAISVDPVEKKPLYHFLPGTRIFSFGTMGCNLSCSFCQNAQLSQSPRLGQPIRGHNLTPEALVSAALDSGSKSIAYTYSEPTVFLELVEDTALLARARGLKNVLVTNGFMSPESLDALGPADTGPIQAANVDLKAFTEAFYKDQCGARLAPVLKNLKHMRELGWWLELTTLLIPGLNDGPDELAELAAFIVRELGPDTPWHLSRFHPEYRLLDRPVTPTETLTMARDVGHAAGLRYVYIGNASGPGFGDTRCGSCGEVVLERDGFAVRGSLPEGRCGSCGAILPGVWA